MLNRLLAGAVGAVLLLPGVAMAQEDPCYVDPTAPECVDVEDTTETREPSEDEGEAEEMDVSVLDEAQEADALASTGLDGGLVFYAAGLLGLGALLLVATRRRRHGGDTV